MHTIIRHKLVAVLPFLLLFANSCSMVYSPFLHLPAAAPSEGDIAISGSGAIMPETNGGGSGSAEGSMLVGISNRVSLGGRLWSRIGDIKSRSIDGTSLDAIVALGTTEKPRMFAGVREAYRSFDVALVPRVMSLFGTNQLGLVGSFSAALWMPQFWVFRPYVATGIIGGWGVSNNGWSSGNGHGYGMINNLGVASTFDRHFTLNFELANPIVHMSLSSASTRPINVTLLPSMTLAYQF